MTLIGAKKSLNFAQRLSTDEIFIAEAGFMRESLRDAANERKVNLISRLQPHIKVSFQVGDSRLQTAQISASLFVVNRLRHGDRKPMANCTDRSIAVLDMVCSDVCGLKTDYFNALN